MQTIMKTATFEWYGYNVEVDYELEDKDICIIDWQFENEVIVDELNLYNRHARSVFEEEIIQMIAEYETRRIRR